MLLTIVLILVLIAVVAWLFFDFDMPEVALPAAVPCVGAGVLYFYGGPLAWATVGLLAIIAGYCLYRLFSAHERQDKASK